MRCKENEDKGWDNLCTLTNLDRIRMCNYNTKAKLTEPSSKSLDKAHLFYRYHCLILYTTGNDNDKNHTIRTKPYDNKLF